MAARAFYQVQSHAELPVVVSNGLLGDIPIEDPLTMMNEIIKQRMLFRQVARMMQAHRDTLIGKYEKRAETAQRPMRRIRTEPMPQRGQTLAQQKSGGQAAEVAVAVAATRSINTATGKSSTWNRLEQQGDSAAEFSAEAASAEGMKRSGQRSIDGPWEEHFDEEGNPYFVNTATGLSTWDRPRELSVDDTDSVVMKQSASLLNRTILGAKTKKDDGAVLEILETPEGSRLARASDDNGQTPLMTACRCRRWRIVEALLPLSELDAQDNGGNTALHALCTVGNAMSSAGLVSLLCKAGADPNVAGSDGCTPLHWAAAAGTVPSVPLLRALVEGGADPSLRDKHGEHALDYVDAFPVEPYIQKLLSVDSKGVAVAVEGGGVVSSAEADAEWSLCRDDNNGNYWYVRLGQLVTTRCRQLWPAAEGRE